MEIIFIITISIHAPAKGATEITDEEISHMDNFNPRSREGSDVTKACFEPCLKISIHAPAKGATRSRRKRGCSGRFQSTLPRRERLLQASIIKRFDNFNPRSREGSDTALKPKTLGGIISIHAPAKGATSSLKFTVQNFLFQSTLPRRERQLYL